MAASSIDMMLPAFKDIRAQFGLAPDSNRVAWIVTAFFLGIAVGQLIYGPLSDKYGRKPMLFIGLAIMMAGAAGAASVNSLEAVFVCRALWGLGAAAPRSLAIAMVRDRYSGDEMARTMGFVMATFMVVPIFAPSFGTVLLRTGSWRVLFWVPVFLAAGLAVWLITVPETLPLDRRRGVRPRDMLEALRIVSRTCATVAYGVAACCLFSTMASFIGNVEVIVNDVYGHERIFPLIFGALGIVLALGSLLSARVVVRLGLERLIRRAVIFLVISNALYVVVALATGGHPAFWLLCVFNGSMLVSVAILNANTNTAAMVPVPHVAGMAAALLGATATAAGALVGAIVSAAFDNTVRPFAIGVFIFAAVAAFFILIVAPPPPGPQHAPTSR